VRVRGGVYHESVKFKHSGTNDAGVIFDREFDLNAIRWITLEAYKDEHVTLDGSVAIPAGKWELVKGCKNTYSAPFPLTEPWGLPWPAGRHRGQEGIGPQVRGTLDPGYAR